MVYILLCDGFEDMEAVVPCDLMRRAGIPVAYVGVHSHTITGSQGLRLVADCMLSEIRMEKADMIVLSGGRRGVENLLNTEVALEAVRKAWNSGAWIGAICAAPVILAKLAIAPGHRACCYPDPYWQTQMSGMELVADAAVVTDGKIITGTSAGCAIPFGLALVEVLKGRAAADAVKEGIVLRSVPIWRNCDERT